MGGIEWAQHDGGADASATVAKRSGDAAGRRALTNEATVLGRVAHPGVVRIVAYTESDRHAELLTERAPGLTLAELVVEGASALAAVGAAGAAVVADLHALGIAHGGLAPDHLICCDGRVVLCSFGRAGDTTAAARDRDVADLVVAIAESSARLPEPSTRVERRLRRRLDDLLVGAASRSLSAADLAANLAAIAAEPGKRDGRDPCDDTAGATPFDAGVAPAHRAGTPDPPGPARPAPAAHVRPWRERVARNDRVRSVAAPTRLGHRRRNVAVGAGAGLVVVALWISLAPDRPDPTTSPPSVTPVATPSATSVPSPPPPPTPDAPEVARAHVTVVGHLIAIDDIWFEVGRQGDIVRVGDWDCNGTVSPAVLRPATGEVFVFRRWVDDDEVERVGPLTVLADAVDIEASRTPSCDALVAVDARGRESILEVGS